jgi:hypothetical protein
MAPVRVVVLSFFYPLVIFTHEFRYSLLSQLLAFHHFTSYFSLWSLSMLTGIRLIERGRRHHSVSHKPPLSAEQSVARVQRP